MDTAFYTFATDNAVLVGLLALCLVTLAILVFKIVYKGIHLMFRSLNIALRGWPPIHCDADGDPRTYTDTQTEDDHEH